MININFMHFLFYYLFYSLSEMGRGHRRPRMNMKVVIFNSATKECISLIIPVKRHWKRKQVSRAIRRRVAITQNRPFLIHGEMQLFNKNRRITCEVTFIALFN